ncbi:response regulator transcription factor [Luteolibacter algae]|uniref:Response regulator transcription factor n=1 Tax=Luteolibacter algae TaxID=454151 RepID=A0ABW5DA38_9BACT
MRILIVEDNQKTARAIRNGLKAEGYEAVVAKTGNEGYRFITEEAFDLIVLDWMLPERSGIELLRVLRNLALKPPVLLLTARDSVEDRVMGLDSGADDYLVKPFDFTELLARLRALMRRAIHEEVMRKQIGDLVIDLRSRQAWRAGEEIILTPREYDFLAFLVRYEGQAVTRQMLAKEVWREPNRSTPLDNVIDVHIARLRRKIDDGRPQKLIKTVRGVGFLLSSNLEATA